MQNPLTNGRIAYMLVLPACVRLERTPRASMWPGFPTVVNPGARTTYYTTHRFSSRRALVELDRDEAVLLTIGPLRWPALRTHS